MERRFSRDRDGDGVADRSGAVPATGTRVIEDPSDTTQQHVQHEHTDVQHGHTDVHAHDDAPVRDREHDDATHSHAPTAVASSATTPAAAGGVRTDTMREIRARQRDEHGGLNWGAAFFGWLVAVGLGALLGGILAATGAAIGLTEDTGVSTSDADTLSIAGAIALLVVLAIAYYCGGYVAGRMSRFDGTRQGIGVWIVGILVTIALAVLAIVAGSEYNVLEQVNLPSLPIDEQSFATGGLIATVAALVVTLLAAALGGKAGERFHRKIDRTAVVD